MLGNKEDAQDITQEAFIKAKENLSSFNTEKSFSSWLFKIVSNLCRNYLHKRSTTQEVSLEIFNESPKKEGKLALLDKNPNPLEIVEKKEEEKLFKEAISSLPSEYEEVFILRVIEGLSTKKTADTLKISQGMVEIRFHRAKKLLKQRMKSYLEKG
jgi:RNA polymerase sigma-70 factor (ECF subfamily)